MEKRLKKQKFKVRDLRILVFALVLILLFGSCSRNTKKGFSLIQGSLAWARQNWNFAITSFMNVVEEENSEVINDYGNFGLATVYLSQNEYEAALGRLKKINKTADKKLLSSSFYQEGIIAFKMGDFEKATKMFKSSLELEPNAIDAKVNYELSLRAKPSMSNPKSEGVQGFKDSKNEYEGEDIIFDYIRQKEEQKWKSLEKKYTPSNVPDY